MSVNLSTVDLSNVEGRRSQDPIPSDWYKVRIVDSEMKPTSSGTGQYLEFTMEVVEGPYQNRKVFDRLNLQNPNQTAMEIAYSTLKEIYDACGVVRVDDSSQLHNIPMLAKVVVDPAGTDPKSGKSYDASNNVKKYAKVGEHQHSTGNAPASGPAPVAGGGAPSWATGNAAPAPAAAAPPQPATPQTQAAPAQGQPQPWPQPPAPAAAAPAQATLAPTSKADGIPYEEFIKNGWTDEALVQEGYFAWQQPTAPAAPSAPTAPAAPSAPPAASAPAGGATPSWAK